MMLDAGSLCPELISSRDNASIRPGTLCLHEASICNGPARDPCSAQAAADEASAKLFPKSRGNSLASSHDSWLDAQGRRLLEIVLP